MIDWEKIMKKKMKREKTYKLQQSEKEIFEFRFSTIH